MIRIAIVVICVLALAVDYYIYRRVVARHGFGRWFRLGYVVGTVLVDVGVVVALTLYWNASDAASAGMMHAVMWMIGLFFLNAVPKMIYALVSLGDYLVARFTHRISHVFGYAGTLLGVLAAGVMIHGMTWGRSEIVVKRVDLEFAKLPASFDGMRIVQFSDPHIGTLIRRDRALERMVDTINSLRPDLVINSGDIVNTHAWEFDEGAMRILERIRSRYGVYAVLGNHDLGIYMRDTIQHSMRESVEELMRRQRQMGWHVLVNATEYVSNGEDSIAVSGLNYPDGYRHNGHVSDMTGADLVTTYGGVPDSLFNLTISHAPQLWKELLAASKSDLTVSGHVHAMQMKFRLGNWTWSPACLMYDEWSGLYRRGERYLYINDGFGYVMYPMRIGTKPEITLFVLHTKTE